MLTCGVTVTVKAAQVRLCHSRNFFVRACPRERQEPKSSGLDRWCRDGFDVRRPRPGLFLLRGHLHARDLRQHEDGGGCDLRRQEPGLQPPVPADVRPLSRGSGRLNPGVGPGEGTGRQPGRHCRQFPQRLRCHSRLERRVPRPSFKLAHRRSSAPVRSRRQSCLLVSRTGSTSLGNKGGIRSGPNNWDRIMQQRWASSTD